MTPKVTPRTVKFYFDFISPYSYLANELIERGAEEEIPISREPVALGAILSQRGVVGPGAIPSRRRIAIEDMLLLTRHHGIEFVGPPSHPFNPLYALRTALSVTDPKERKRLVTGLFRAAWAHGESIDQPESLRAIVFELGFDLDPEELSSRPDLRRGLKANTEEAIQKGVYGVPSFCLDDLVFFGHDRLDLLRTYIRGALPLDREKRDNIFKRSPEFKSS